MTNTKVIRDVVNSTGPEFYSYCVTYGPHMTKCKRFVTYYDANEFALKRVEKFNEHVQVVDMLRTIVKSIY